MDTIPRPKGRYQLIFVAMAALMLCSLIVGVAGSVVLDAFSGNDSGAGGNSAQIDASVEEAFRSTAVANPNDPAAMAALANYLANTGKLADAIPFYEKAIELAPDDYDLRLDFARSLASGDMIGDAELQFQKAIELNPAGAQAHFYLGELYYNSSPPRTLDAIDQYEKTIALGPSSFVAVRAQERLVALGIATPEASPVPAD